MCMVAQGGADAYLEIGIHAWDMAAGALVVTEAGGVVVDMTGGSLGLRKLWLISPFGGHMLLALMYAQMNSVNKFTFFKYI